MTARVHLEIQRAAGVDVRHVRPAGDVGVADGACPGCGCTPFEVRGANLRTDPNRRHDGRMSDGRCVACGDAVGHIYAIVDTIFGIEEDDRMLNGRAMVY